MEISNTAYSYGEAAESEFEAAIEEFAASIHRPGTRDELLALRIRRVEQEIIRKRGGIFEITTEIIADRSIDDYWRFARYTISGTWTSSTHH